MTNYLEDAEQIALIDWAQYHKIHNKNCVAFGYLISDCLFAIPNGGKRNSREAGRLKRMGVMPGIPDLMLSVPHNGSSGLFIEMKRPAANGRPAGRLSKTQAVKIERLTQLGYKCEVCYGHQQAIEAINGYLGNNL